MTPKSVFLARLLPVVYFKSPPTYWYLRVHLSESSLHSPKLLLQSSHLRKLHHQSPGCSASIPLPRAPRIQFIRKGCGLGIHHTLLPSGHPGPSSLIRTSGRSPATFTFTLAPGALLPLSSQGPLLKTHPRSLSFRPPIGWMLPSELKAKWLRGLRPMGTWCWLPSPAPPPAPLLPVLHTLALLFLVLVPATGPANSLSPLSEAARLVPSRCGDFLSDVTS